ncbi:MAG TPA: hypothetical protein VMN56_10005 [Casimicrobiaceae bacterium]|nr:hypothetical protein [Casimicrobiaceae bacterium]
MKASLLALLLATAALAAEPPREMHGSGDGFATPGVALAWAVQRGASEAAATVIVRVATDPAIFPWMSVVGVDPFSKAELPRLAATKVDNVLDVQLPRAQFADYPNTEFRFYASEPDARAAAPSLVVFYHGVPDTAPEFTDSEMLHNYLIERMLRSKK